MLHAKPRFTVDVRVDIIFVIAQFDIVPLGIIKALGHLSYLFSYVFIFYYGTVLIAIAITAIAIPLKCLDDDL